MTRCQGPPEERLLRDLQRRIKDLENAFGPWRQIVGIDTTPEQSIAIVISIDPVAYSPGNQRFNITWQSQPGEQYQVTMSTDATTWTNLQSPIPASAAPEVTTSYLSPVYAIDSTPRYFRVRRFPMAFVGCPG